jgi:hypothetical protein
MSDLHANITNTPTPISDSLTTDSDFVGALHCANTLKELKNKPQNNNSYF